MITRIRIDGEADSADRMHAEFRLVRDALEELFERWDVAVTPAHEIVENCHGDADVSVFGNWKGRAVVHLDTQKGNDQIPRAGFSVTVAPSPYFVSANTGTNTWG